ncbi:MAG TPA: alpha-L-arabinofuranosidase C-terminal domain-containing protein [Lacunisphaera sp.]|nr:alpha-L-arabinofuranosidase C-terminal domain-containing protein [Lacunisphaera sp.]
MKSPKLSLFVALLLLPAAGLRAAPIEVKLDAAKTGAPINPFIYGQFIEHLGRCIYGGIWAEMLEDRKFYFPITAEYAPYRGIVSTDFPGQVVERGFPVVGASPWQIIGDAKNVTMVKEGAFVGDHSPRVNAGAGIRQRDLGVKAGLRYDGYVWAKPLAGKAEVEVTLVWGEGATDRVATKLTFSGKDYSKQKFSLTPKAGSESAALFELRVTGGDVLLGPPSIMPSDNVNGLRKDTLALLKQLNGTVYRWPGGNFVSGYDWRDGIGDRDRRPPRKNPAWTGVEHNDFGTDEFVAFAREIGTEPMIAANTGYGDAYSAAQWVEYVNGAATTLAGGWRAKNGHTQPYGVKYWCVGNEMWGTFQLGWMQLHHYTIKHNLVADAMWRVDPTLKLVAVGDLETVNRQHDPEAARKNLPWSKGMLEASADKMSMLSEHFYAGRVPWTKDGRVDVATHVGLVKANIRKKAEGHRVLQASLPNLKGRIVPIAMDEWNYWHREYTYGELGCIYELQDGLGIAAGLHEFYRQSDIVQMAHYAQTVNVIGAIKTTHTAAEMETTGLVLQLYREKFGQTPLVVSTDSGPVDVMAALTQDGKKLTLSVVNPTSDEISVNLAATGMTVAGPAVRWFITGPSAEAHNAPGKPRVVDIQRSDATATALKVPALSATLFELPLK